MCRWPALPGSRLIMRLAGPHAELVDIRGIPCGAQQVDLACAEPLRNHQRQQGRLWNRSPGLCCCAIFRKTSRSRSLVAILHTARIYAPTRMDDVVNTIISQANRLFVSYSFADDELFDDAVRTFADDQRWKYDKVNPRTPP